MTLEFSAIEFEYCGALELLEEFFHKYINIRSCQLLRINPETKKWNCSMATRANRKETISDVIEYSCAMKSHFRKFGNQMSGSGNHLCNYASLLA